MSYDITGDLLNANFDYSLYKTVLYLKIEISDTITSEVDIISLSINNIDLETRITSMVNYLLSLITLNILWNFGYKVLWKKNMIQTIVKSI